MSLIALGVMPYITASIVVQLASSLSPTLAAIKKEGESGRKKLNQYTRYGTVFLTAVQGYFLAAGLESLAAANGISAVVEQLEDSIAKLKKQLDAANATKDAKKIADAKSALEAREAWLKVVLEGAN
jgi:preprotein translocase subunit SecY